MSDISGTSHSVLGTSGSSIDSNNQDSVSKKGKNERPHTSGKKDDAFSAVQEHLERNGSGKELLDNMSEQGSPVFSKKLTAEEEKYFKDIKHHFEVLLPKLTSVLNKYEIEIVGDFFRSGEEGLALETVVGIVSEQSKTISQEVFSLIMEAAATMEMDMEDIKIKLTGHVSDE